MPPPMLRIAILSSPGDLFARVVQRFCHTMRQHRSCIFKLGGAGRNMPAAAQKWQPDGILARLTPANLQPAAQLSIPMINFSSMLPQSPVPQITWSEQSIGQSAAQYLLDTGYQRFGLVTTTEGKARIREEVFINMVTEAGCPVQALALPVSFTAWHTGEGNWQANEDQLRQLIKGLTPPAAIFATQDRLGAAVIEVCHEMGINVPDQIAVLGVDNDELICETAAPPLSSIELPAEAVGQRAAETLLAMLGGHTVASTMLLPIRRVVVRGSTDAVGVEDPIIRQAVRYIRQHATEGLSISDLCDHLNISRRPFERRFKTALGRTPLQEIHQTQIRRARELLMDTDRSVQQIAREVGFRDASRLSIVYRRLLGNTPGQSRAQRCI